jgi:hypothetical protein
MNASWFNMMWLEKSHNETPLDWMLFSHSWFCLLTKVGFTLCISNTCSADLLMLSSQPFFNPEKENMMRWPLWICVLESYFLGDKLGRQSWHLCCLILILFWVIRSIVSSPVLNSTLQTKRLLTIRWAPMCKNKCLYLKRLCFVSGNIVICNHCWIHVLVYGVVRDTIFSS